MSVDIVQTVWGIQICNYSALGALAFTTWDILISTGDEIEQIWKRPWKKLNYLYIFLRYFPFASQALSAVLFLKLSAGLSLSPQGCRAFMVFLAVSSLLLMMGVELVSVLRINALYRDNKPLTRWIVPSLVVAEYIVMIVFLILTLHSKKFGDTCGASDFPLSAIKFSVPPLIIETFFFVLTAVKFHQSLKEGYGHIGVISKFMRDGLWAFALPLITLTINSCFSSLLDGPISAVAAMWMLALPGFCGYRLILNLSHLLSVRTQHGTDTRSDGVLFDSVGVFVTGIYDDGSPGLSSSDYQPTELSCGSVDVRYV